MFARNFRELRLKGLDSSCIEATISAMQDTKTRSRDTHMLRQERGSQEHSCSSMRGGRGNTKMHSKLLLTVCG